MNFRAQFLNASAVVVYEFDASADSVADVIGLVTDMKRPDKAVTMVIMDADGNGGVAARIRRDMPDNMA